MAVTKLSADAPPYLSRNRLHLSPHPPHMAMCAAPYHAAALPFPAAVTPYPYVAPFLLAAPRPVAYGFTRPPPPAHLLLKPAVNANLPFLSPLPPPLSSESIPSPTSTLLPLGGTALSSSPSPPTSPPVRALGPKPKALSSPPSSPPVVRALSPEAPPFVPLPSDPFVPPPFGSAPHKLISLAGAGGVEAEKRLQAEAAAAAAAAGAKPAKPPRRGITKGPRRRRQAAEPAPVVVPRGTKQPARSPPPLFTTRPETPVPEPLWPENPQLTTLMIRNIPNKLTPGQLMLLLDDHCARANKKRVHGAPLAAYDFIYLRMDFSRMGSSNMGYAFVNLTTAEAAHGLHHALHGARWKVFASKKVIDICPARIQGKEALVRHFSRAKFACRTAAFLPAVFSPPRDGAATGPSAVTCYVGNLVAPCPPPAPRPRPAAARPARGTTWKPKPIRIVQKEEEEASVAASV